MVPYNLFNLLFTLMNNLSLIKVKHEIRDQKREKEKGLKAQNEDA